MTTYAFEFDNKIITFTNKDTMLFCANIQVGRKFKDLTDKVVLIKVDVEDRVIEEHQIHNKSFDDVIGDYYDTLN